MTWPTPKQVSLTADDRSVLTVEDPLERVERKEILREGQARARRARPRPAEKASSQKPGAGRQGALLLPINGKRPGNRAGRPPHDISAYQPSIDVVDWARREYGIDATADSLLGSFRDHQPAFGRWPPLDPDKGFKNWIRRETKFAAVDRHRPARGSLLDAGNAQFRRWER
jgi:hypothetical protein